jgi:Ca2+-binding EF-hand superfamily protein
LCLTNFSSQNQSQRSITPAEQEEIRHAFSLFDSEGTGDISIKELREALEDGSERSQHILRQLPKTEFGRLTEEEFTVLLTQRNDDDDNSVDDMERIFTMFDKEKKGYISVADLKRIAEELGESMSPAELKEMIDRASASPGGKVNLEDFSSIMTKQLWA